MRRKFLAAVLIGALFFGGGCKKDEPEGPAEKVGRKIDEGVKEAREQIGKGLEKTGKALEEAGKKLQEKEKQ